MSIPNRLLHNIESDGSMCSLCNRPIRLEDCKIDEDGLPAHEECYVQKVCPTKIPVQNGKKTTNGSA